MKYALVGGLRRETEPGLSGECPVCHAAMVPKCGERRVWHWAHRQKRVCDHWWEPETEWHRDWKNQFPVEWQEVIHSAENGERHIADVKTEHKGVIEFQHSHLRPEERHAREAVYRPMVWVVDGLRRKRDRSQFFDALKSGKTVLLDPLTWTIFARDCALVRDWAASGVSVFFDFGNTNEPGDVIRFPEPVLWLLYPKSPSGWVYVSPVRRSEFIDAFRNGTPLSAIALMTASKIVRPTKIARSTPLPGFARYMAARRLARRRSRF